MYMYVYIYTLITLYIERDSLLKPPSPAQFCQLLAAELDWLVLSRCISELFVNINTYTWYPPAYVFNGFCGIKTLPTQVWTCLSKVWTYLSEVWTYLSEVWRVHLSGSKIQDVLGVLAQESWLHRSKIKISWGKTAQESWIRGSKTQDFSRRVARSWILDPGLLDPRLPKRSLWASWILDH